MTTEELLKVCERVIAFHVVNGHIHPYHANKKKIFIDFNGSFCLKFQLITYILYIGSNTIDDDSFVDSYYNICKQYYRLPKYKMVFDYIFFYMKHFLKTFRYKSKLRSSVIYKY